MFPCAGMFFNVLFFVFFFRHVAFLSVCKEECFIICKMCNRNDRKASYKYKRNNLKLNKQETRQSHVILYLIFFNNFIYTFFEVIA